MLNRADIVATIERYLPLKRAGANFVACCPFHNEKSPSFTVSQTKQFYHCFGCGAHGTAIGFLIEYNGCGFIDAVKDLAQSVGMQVPEIKSERPPSKSEEGDDLFAVLLKAAKFYRSKLRDAPNAIEYLKRRGLSGEIAKQFGIGYAPPGRQQMGSALPEFSAKTLLTVGLTKENDQGERYDRFRDRIMFPIVDQRGHVIAFGGRVLDQGEPKYLNSPETPLFEKGRELYGLYQGRRAIRDAGRVIVVEGYMDVVALAQHGVGYAVATLGTATTPMHVQKLLRQSDEVIFCFDGDNAGRRAAWRALENSLEQLSDGKKLSFLFLPQGEDPDTYVRKEGKQAFEALLDVAEPLSAFLLRELIANVDIKTSEGRARLLEDARPLVTRVAAPVLSLLLRKELARVTGLTQQELDAQYKVKSSTPVKVPAKAPARSAGKSFVRPVIETLIFDPSLAAGIDRANLAGKSAVGMDALELEALTQILEALAIDPKIRLGEYFRDSKYEDLIKNAETHLLLRHEMGFGETEIRNEFEDAWNKLALELDNEHARELNAKGEFKAFHQALVNSRSH